MEEKEIVFIVNNLKNLKKAINQIAKSLYDGKPSLDRFYSTENGKTKFVWQDKERKNRWKKRK